MCCLFPSDLATRLCLKIPHINSISKQCRKSKYSSKIDGGKSQMEGAAYNLCHVRHQGSTQCRCGCRCYCCSCGNPETVWNSHALRQKRLSFESVFDCTWHMSCVTKESPPTRTNNNINSASVRGRKWVTARMRARPQPKSNKRKRLPDEYATRGSALRARNRFPNRVIQSIGGN